MLRTLIAVLLWGASAAQAAEVVVWEIGKPDRSWAEFAIAGKHAAFPERFGARPVVFEVGKSDAARDWPFIQPGPIDAWAGSRTHPFTVRFDLPAEPKGVFTLRIELADTHGQSPPTYAVTVGGRTGQFRLPSGGGDGSLGDPKVGKPYKIEIPVPAAMLRQGPNEIVLCCTDNSWVQYDAVTLVCDPDAKMPDPEVQAFTVKPTPFYVRRNGQVGRAVDVSVAVTAPVGDLSLRVEGGGETIEVLVQQLPQFGSVLQEVGVPDAPGPLELKVTATVAGRSKTATTTVSPQRKWRIFVAPSAHTDIGYTHLQPECAERHCQNTDAALKILETFADFRWNLEVAWQAEEYLKLRKPEQIEKFLRAAREGKIGVQALYCNILTGLCSHEEACRWLYCAHRLNVDQKVPYRSAMISDVPTQEASVPMILAHSGIRYFSSGINNTRGPTFTQMYNRCPCWWEGPDGSRVLMMYVPGYAHASGWGLDQSVDAARSRIVGALRGYEERKDYPYDAVFLHGAVSDNCLLNPRLAEVVKQWNERYEFPKIILCHNAEFFEHIEKNFADQLPVFRGSAGTYWEDGAGSSAHETTLVRNAHEMVANGEKLLALTQRIKPETEYPTEAIENAWRNCLLYDEHTWGAHCSISQPESEFTKAQWKIKSQFAVDADQQSRQLLDQGTRALASLVKTDGRSLLVINPTSWPRTDVLRTMLPEGTTVAEPGVATCDGYHGTYLLVKDVPACGYRVLKLAASGERSQPQSVEGTTIESALYRVAFDPATGALTSVVDKESGRELVDAQAPYRLNQYLYVAGGNGTRIVEGGPEPKLTISSPEKATLRRLKLGTLGEMMVVETSAAMTPKITTTVIVWNDVKRIDITNHLSKTRTYEKEAAYFAFPFAAEKPTFRYEVPAGIVTANTDMLPGACLDWFTVQHFVEVAGDEGVVAWASPDAPLVCFQDINRGKWQTKLEFTNGHLYAYVMNNYWFTNYLAGQGGDFVFRFSLTSRPQADSIASAQFGWNVSNPLAAVVSDTNPAGTLPAQPTSLVSVAERNVMLVGAKRADGDAGLILRLWEINGQPTTAHIRLSQSVAQKATACNLVEDTQGPLEIRDNTIAVPMRAHGLATVRVE